MVNTRSLFVIVLLIGLLVIYGCITNPSENQTGNIQNQNNQGHVSEGNTADQMEESINNTDVNQSRDKNVGDSENGQTQEAKNIVVKSNNVDKSAKLITIQFKSDVTKCEYTFDGETGEMKYDRYMGSTSLPYEYEETIYLPKNVEKEHSTLRITCGEGSVEFDYYIDTAPPRMMSPKVNITLHKVNGKPKDIVLSWDGFRDMSDITYNVDVQLTVESKVIDDRHKIVEKSTSIIRKNISTTDTEITIDLSNVEYPPVKSDEELNVVVNVLGTIKAVDSWYNEESLPEINVDVE